MDLALILATIAATVTGKTVPYWKEIFQNVLDGNNPYPTVARFPTWMTIEVGIYSCKCAYLRALDAVCTVSNWARDIINQNTFIISSVRATVELVKVRVADMGFTTATSYKDICAWALANGLDLCQAEDAGYCRQQYTDQPMHESLYFAMEAVIDSDCDPSILEVCRDGDGLRLYGDGGWPERLCYPDYSFVFRRRK